ncbi:uncharacterized protein EDB91DRAFT_880513 [Suillus paluster]|uniref:uncharacterized protein n=1 Tax=Suillus paluster TaxID=48578 RepID=UPI001B8604FF|nr:uncharacterized protein EDB91DRAFT_880513 [Suillus paluster]KAG1748468.1 hypothetical protein EDB91DRAFT_880513 [Suillus paluster]
MHGCLRLAEILEVIFHFVFNSRPLDSGLGVSLQFPLPALTSPPYAQDPRSILQLALTCSTFRDLALDVLYSDLRDPLPLFCYLSPKLCYSHRPSPVDNTPEQLRTLVLRAARVHIFFNPGSQLGTDSACYSFFLRILASAPKVTPLFPKLHSLTWYDSDLTSIPTLSLFLPTLETLSLYIQNEPFCKAVIPGLRTAAPRLKALEFRGVNLTRDSTSEIESLLLSYPEGLTALSLLCCDISSSLLHHIAPWPRLQWLTLQLDSNSIRTVPLHVLQPFPALTHLHISCKSLGLCKSFLRAFQILRMGSDTRSFGCRNLKTIHVNAKRCSPASIWSEFLSILARTELEHIILSEGCYRHAQLCLAPTPFEFHPLLVRPTTLADLRTLIISPVFTSSIALTDSDILTLARTCPYLEILNLGVSNTPVSLYALGILVSRCRELCDVSLCVDARLDALGAAPLNDDNQVALQPNTRLRKLFIGFSPIACVGPLDSPTAPDLMRSIPRFLNTMAPRLFRILQIEAEEGLQKMYEERWNVVSDTLKAMAKGEVDDGN